MNAMPEARSIQGPRGRRDTLGCSMSMLGYHQELVGQGFVAYRKSHDGAVVTQVETPPSARGVLVGVALSGGHRRRIFEGAHSTLVGFAPGSCYIRPFSDAYRADIESAFDFFLMEISQEALARCLEETGLSPAECLGRVAGEIDQVLAHLAGALLPVLNAPDGASPLFVDQVACAMFTHLATHYHGGRVHLPGHLSEGQLARGKELLAASLDGQVLIGDIAEACGVSRSHFIRGFRAAVGTTPYQWLLGRRVERARDLLLHSRLSLAEVAVASGFSDQSHMTRTFRRITGAAPGAWRRGR